MSEIEKAIFLWGSLLFIIACIIIAYCFIRRYIVNTVKNSSSALNELQTINEKNHYKQIKKDELHAYSCSSRSQFNRFNLDNFFIEIISDNFDFYQKLIKAIEYNRKEIAKYTEKVGKIDFSESENNSKRTKIPFKVYQYIERKCFKKMMLSEPVTDVCIVCRKEYTTPAGRTHIYSDTQYDYKQLFRFFKQSQEIKTQREIRKGQIEHERSLMTSAMRYEILKRDNYRCQICGSTAQDGVKLHIDHIIPVSKGGKTVPENLRVLCDRCNLGKSDKIE